MNEEEEYARRVFDALEIAVLAGYFIDGEDRQKAARYLDMIVRILNGGEIEGGFPGIHVTATKQYNQWVRDWECGDDHGDARVRWNKGEGFNDD